ncbi:hypothetical protein [Cysteiniphilum sp. JM-1]|uniref:hypothetical protein n=1 Tax=Cysteiniphilum sp. JM-1 TaxID=2610891 RepID=UPI001246A4FF|nr:hypothetical protein [Cysteiniphilum sp. JM-1]
MNSIEKKLQILEQLPQIDSMNIYMEFCACQGDKNEILRRLDIEWSTVQYHLKKLAKFQGGDLFVSQGKFSLTNLGLDTLRLCQMFAQTFTMLRRKKNTELHFRVGSIESVLTKLIDAMDVIKNQQYVSMDLKFASLDKLLQELENNSLDYVISPYSSYQVRNQFKEGLLGFYHFVCLYHPRWAGASLQNLAKKAPFIAFDYDGAKQMVKRFSLSNNLSFNTVLTCNNFHIFLRGLFTLEGWGIIPMHDIPGGVLEDYLQSDKLRFFKLEDIDAQPFFLYARKTTSDQIFSNALKIFKDIFS